MQIFWGWKILRCKIAVNEGSAVVMCSVSHLEVSEQRRRCGKFIMDEKPQQHPKFPKRRKR